MSKDNKATKVLPVELYPVELAAYLRFEEVWRAAGPYKEETLRRRLARVRAIRRIGNEYHVDTWLLKQNEPRIFEALIRERVRKELSNGETFTNDRR